MAESSHLDVDGFEDYQVDHVPTPAGLVAFFTVFVGCSLALAVPIICARDAQLVGALAADARNDADDTTQENVDRREQEMVEMSPQTAEGGTSAEEMHAPRNTAASDPALYRTNPLMRSDQPAGYGTGDQRPQQPEQTPHSAFSQDRDQQINFDRRSGIESVTGSSRGQNENNAPPAERRKSNSSWTFAGRRPWGHNRPLGRADFVMRSLEAERQSQASEEGSYASRRSRSSRVSRNIHSSRQRRSTSDAASSVLSGEVIEGEAEFYRRRYIRRSQSRRRSRRAPSESDNSLMPPLSPDALSPDDAADAHDLGRVIRLDDSQSRENELTKLGPLGPLCGCFDKVLDLAETDFESRRILELAVPASVGAMADPLFRLVLLAIIATFVDTDSMAAFVLVILFVRLTTEEVSGAVTDVESNIVKDAISQGGDEGFREAGRCVQLAIVMQLLVGVPILLLWAMFMDDVVIWLVDNERIAGIATAYAKIIIVDYILRGATRAFMLPFHLSGQAQFERTVDVTFTLLTVVAIAGIAVYAHDESDQESLDVNPSLEQIGWIQVIIGIAKTITKVTYVFHRGWIRQYRRGFLGSISLTEVSAVCSFLMQVLPLFVGSLLELGEWDVLVVFARHLGGAEVAGFVIVGNLWEVCLAATEGLGEAASVRVSYYLSEGFPVEAKLLSSKVAFWACVQAFVLTSLFLISGPNISSSLTTDNVLQNIINNLLGLTSLANIPMTLAQVYWSLVGAQGDYAIASAMILLSRWLITIPLAAICVFGYDFDVDSMAGCVATGYATAAFALSVRIFNADWMGLSISAQEELLPFDDDDGDLSSDSSSGHF